MQALIALLASVIPDEASTLAPKTDHLFYFLVAVTVFFSAGIFLAVFYFAIRYRRRSEQEVPGHIHGLLSLELLWSIVPLALTMVMFAWGASVFMDASRPPDNSMSVYVVGKQWMWKLQHHEGQREINELHIPVGVPVRLTMTSEDVIHSFFVPAFRTKQDVLPGRYTTTWFQATKPGKYHLFCAEYCGTNHSGMTGWVYAMEPQDYQAWLSGGAPEGSMASTGEKLFQDLGCANCHRMDTQGRCPNLVGLFGSSVELAGGGTVKADEELHPGVHPETQCQNRGRLSAHHAHVPGTGDRGRRHAVDRVRQEPGTSTGRAGADQPAPKK